MVDRNIDRIQTNINISTVNTSSFGANYNHSITIENTGSVTLQTNDFTILINGEIKQFLSSKSYLYPGKTAIFNVSNLPGAGEKKLKAITENGIVDYYEYTI
jgi:archaellum component FlaF (FlaF/FlaG flagellin family)